MNKLSKILATGVLLGAAVTPNVNASEESRARTCFQPYQTKIEQLLPENQFTEEQESMFLYGYDEAHNKHNKERDFIEESMELGTTELAYQARDLINNIHPAYQALDIGVKKCLGKINYGDGEEIVKPIKHKLENKLRQAGGAMMFIATSLYRDYYTEREDLPNRQDGGKMHRKLYELEKKIFPNIEHTRH